MYPLDAWVASCYGAGTVRYGSENWMRKILAALITAAALFGGVASVTAVPVVNSSHTAMHYYE